MALNHARDEASEIVTELNTPFVQTSDGSGFIFGGRRGSDTAGKTELNQPNRPSASGNDSGDDTVIGKSIWKKYVVTQKLSSNSGEADVYLCKEDTVYYIAKVYHRPYDEKSEALSWRLKAVDSPYVSKTVEFGEFDGRFTEIIEYFKNGSIEKLQGKINFDRLKKIIAEINEGLNALHSCGIIHNDLKPSNIMISDDLKHVSIIDFGVSLLLPDDEDIITVSNGFTPAFAAPEAFQGNGIFWSGSDYYSLGMLSFWLACGHLPYEGCDVDERTRMLLLNGLIFPEEIDKRLKGLILGLTYSDISSRNDPSNPNRRWAYKEVVNWINGVPQPIPPVGTGTFIKLLPFTFDGLRYTTLEHLVLGLSLKWEKGKSIVFNGTLSRHFSTSNPELSKVLDAAAAEVGTRDEDALFFSTLYKLNTGMKYFLWKGHAYRDLGAFGRTILEAFRDGGGFKSPTLHELLMKHIFSEYIDVTEGTGSKEYAVLHSLEDKYQTSKDDKEAEYTLYTLAYQLSGDSTLVYRRKKRPMNNGTAIPDDLVFHNPQELFSYMATLMNSPELKHETDAFLRFIGLTDNGKQVMFSPQVQVWAKKWGYIGLLSRTMAKY